MARTSNYREIKADVMKRISSGEWAPGSLLPNEIELASMYGSARATISRAMRELADEGIIERKRKAGTRVRMLPRRQARFDIPIVRQEVEEQGMSYRYVLVRSQLVEAPDWLAARLRLRPGTRVLHMICLHFADGAPYQHEDRWINLTVLPQALEADFSAESPNEWLVSEVPYSTAEITIIARRADAELAGHMSCDPGDALLQIERSTWWQNQANTFVRLSYRQGHQMTTRY